MTTTCEFNLAGNQRTASASEMTITTDAFDRATVVNDPASPTDFTTRWAS